MDIIAAEDYLVSVNINEPTIMRSLNMENYYVLNIIKDISTFWLAIMKQEVRGDQESQ
jgi:hypothetical protein